MAHQPLLMLLLLLALASVAAGVNVACPSSSFSSATGSASNEPATSVWNLKPSQASALVFS